jgi:hypothetical protein
MHDRTTNQDADRLCETNRLTETSRDQPTVHQLGAAKHEASRGEQMYTVQDAAEILDITVDAVRGRIRRGTLDSKKVDGQVYVRLDPTSHERHTDQATTNPTDSRQLTDDQAQLVESLRERISASEDQIEWLRREVERKDTIIMQMAQRIPELEAAQEEPSEAPQQAAEGPSDGDEGRAEAEKPVERRSWLYRFFFGP